MQFAAPNYTAVATGQSAAALTNVGTSSVLIYGVICNQSGGAGTVTLLEGDGTTTIQATSVPANGPAVVIDILWLAARGLKVTTVNATCTVFHGNPSA